MVSYNGTNYYYIRNLQDDVIGLIDMSGNIVVNYTYDSWGKQLSCTGSLANTLGVANPLRYRGYIFDEETGLYYLQSRYYNPEWGRFINEDNVYSCLSLDLLESNLYTYCMNDPVNNCDYSGEKANINKVAKYWWGWRVWIDNTTVNRIVIGLGVAVIAAQLIPEKTSSTVLSVAFGLYAARFAWVGAPGRGVVFNVANVAYATFLLLAKYNFLRGTGFGNPYTVIVIYISASMKSQ
jgi:RHS repeat-associated protein